MSQPERHRTREELNALLKMLDKRSKEKRNIEKGHYRNKDNNEEGKEALPKAPKTQQPRI